MGLQNGRVEHKDLQAEIHNRIGGEFSILYTMRPVEKLSYPLDPPVGDPAELRYIGPFVPRSDDPALANVLIT
jgi:hypothetical protein